MEPLQYFQQQKQLVEAVLAGAGHREGDTRGVPGADAGDLAETAVGLARQARHAPARDHALPPDPRNRSSTGH